MLSDYLSKILKNVYIHDTYINKISIYNQLHTYLNVVHEVPLFGMFTDRKIVICMSYPAETYYIQYYYYGTGTSANYKKWRMLYSPKVFYNFSSFIEELSQYDFTYVYSSIPHNWNIPSRQKLLSKVTLLNQDNLKNVN